MANTWKTSAKVTDPETGVASREFIQYIQAQDKANAATNAGLSGKIQPWAIHLVFDYPEDGATVLIDAPYARTITKVSTQTNAGTATVTVAGSGTLNGGTNSATTTRLSVMHSSGNGVDEGGNLTVTLSSTSSNCAGLSVTISGVYSLA
jgi:hypothetical protein